MALYLTKKFERLSRKMRIDPDELKISAQEVLAGQYEANLGGGVIKKRIAQDQGKSGGVRVILFFKRDSHLFFYDCWSKSDVAGKGAKEIEDDELEAYKLMARRYLNWREDQLTTLIKAGLLKEV